MKLVRLDLMLKDETWTDSSHRDSKFQPKTFKTSDRQTLFSTTRVSVFHFQYHSFISTQCCVVSFGKFSSSDDSTPLVKHGVDPLTQRLRHPNTRSTNTGVDEVPGDGEQDIKETVHQTAEPLNMVLLVR